MSEDHTRADEILSRKQGGNSSQRWVHSNQDEDFCGAHWNTNSRRSGGYSHNISVDANNVESDSRKPEDSDNIRDRSNRPRSKNRRPDVAVYVPRGRRSQQAGESNDSSNVAAEHDTRITNKQRRPKPAAEVYVPRAKRLPDQSGEAHDQRQPADDIVMLNDHSEIRTMKSSSKEVRRERKHKSKKERVEVSNEKGRDSERKDHLRKHKDKSKKTKERDHTGDGDSCDQELKPRKTGEECQTKDPTPSVDITETCDDQNTTWEEEMKFYDSAIIELGGAFDNESHNSHVQVESESFVDQDSMSWGKDTDLLNSRMEESQQHIHLEASEDIPVATSDTVDQRIKEESHKENTESEVTSAAQITNDASNSNVPNIQVEESTIGHTCNRPSKRIKASHEEDEREMECDHSEENTEKVTEECDMLHQSFEEGKETEEPITEKETSRHEKDKLLTQSGAEYESDPVSGVTLDVSNDDLDGANIAYQEKQKETNIPGEEEKEESTVTEDKAPEVESIEMKNTDAAQVSSGDVEEVEDDDTWDALFTDDGDALDPKLMDELTAAVGKVEIKKTQFDYYNYQPKDPDLDDPSFDHLIEIYDFPTELITRDLLAAFREYKDRGFDIKWVDDNHAIGIFSSAIAAQAVLGMKHPLMKVRPVSLASRQTKLKAKKCATFLEPYRARPETTASVARSLVTGALGIKSNLTREQRDEERRKIKEAKEKRRQERQQKKDAWDGSYGKCAMDM